MSKYRRPESGSWDYRVVVREFEYGKEPEYAIHEAHYDDDGVIFVTQNPVGVMSETPEGLEKEVEWIARALDASLRGHRVLEPPGRGIHRGSSRASVECGGWDHLPDPYSRRDGSASRSA
jgi:hypothetical protein